MPITLMAIIGYFIIGRKNKNYWTSQALAIIVAMGFITVFFYTYTGIIGTNYAILDISSFIISIIFAALLEI